MWMDFSLLYIILEFSISPKVHYNMLQQPVGIELGILQS